MNKVLNWMFFLGGLAQSGAVFFKSSVPNFKKLKEANSKDKFIEELDKAALPTVEQIKKETEVKK